MDFTSFEPHELIVLTRALRLVKFESKEEGASALAGSPFTGQLLAQATHTLLTKTASSIVPNRSNDFLAHGWPEVTENPKWLEAIRFHITQVEQWQLVADHNRIAYIRDLLFPLKATEETVQELLDFANDYHVSQRPSA